MGMYLPSFFTFLLSVHIDEDHLGLTTNGLLNDVGADAERGAWAAAILGLLTCASLEPCD